MYIGIAAPPSISKNPFAEQVKSVPRLHGDGSSNETANGPTIRLKDCSTSDKLSPKMMRRYGDFNPPNEVRIIMAIDSDAKNEIDAVVICTIIASLKALTIIISEFFRLEIAGRRINLIDRL